MKAARSHAQPPGKEQRTPARHEDSYRSDGKLPDPATCPRCRASYVKGRWTWGHAQPDAAVHTCPACRRIEDNHPGGFVTLKGAFLATHRKEVLEVVTALAERERQEHPLQRIIGMQDIDGTVLVTTTDPHLARGIAVALQGACKGELDLHFESGENRVRATWSRDA